MSLLELFCRVDDFWLAFAPRWKQTLLYRGQNKRQRSGQLAESEIMAILIHFHQSHYRDFKAFYTQHVLTSSRADFPGLVSYSRFVQLIPSSFRWRHVWRRAEASVTVSPLSIRSSW